MTQWCHQDQVARLDTVIVLWPGSSTFHFTMSFLTLTRPTLNARLNYEAEPVGTLVHAKCAFTVVLDSWSWYIWWICLVDRIHWTPWKRPDKPNMRQHFFKWCSVFLKADISLSPLNSVHWMCVSHNNQVHITLCSRTDIQIVSLPRLSTLMCVFFSFFFFLLCTKLIKSGPDSQRRYRFAWREITLVLRRNEPLFAFLVSITATLCCIWKWVIMKHKKRSMQPWHSPRTQPFTLLICFSCGGKYVYLLHTITEVTATGANQSANTCRYKPRQRCLILCCLKGARGPSLVLGQILCGLWLFLRWTLFF